MCFEGLLINIVQSFLGFIDFRFCSVAIESFFCLFLFIEFGRFIFGLPRKVGGMCHAHFLLF